MRRTLRERAHEGEDVRKGRFQGGVDGEESGLIYVICREKVKLRKKD